MFRRLLRYQRQRGAVRLINLRLMIVSGLGLVACASSAGVSQVTCDSDGMRTTTRRASRSRAAIAMRTNRLTRRRLRTGDGGNGSKRGMIGGRRRDGNQLLCRGWLSLPPGITPLSQDAGKDPVGTTI